MDADLHILSEEVHALRTALDAERERADEAERLLKVGNREIVAEVEAIARSLGAGVGEVEYLAALHRVKQEEARADNAEAHTVRLREKWGLERDRVERLRGEVKAAYAALNDASLRASRMEMERDEARALAEETP